MSSKNTTDQDGEERIIRLAFDGDALKFREFKAKLKAGLPEGTGVALRGSVVTNKRWEDGKPFDADGRGTSDLDVTLIGDKVMEFWNEDAYYIPALHTKPLCDEDPAVAPALNRFTRGTAKTRRASCQLSSHRQHHSLFTRRPV